MNVAINGFGRIGRAFLKLAIKENINIVAVNDLGDIENLAYLLKYDSAYGKSGLNVEVLNGNLVVNDREIKFLSFRNPLELPWKDLSVDIVVESTGVFNSYEKSKMHLEAGAKKVVVSAPVKDAPEDSGVSGATILMGVNHEKLQTCDISSNASCTTNAGSPVMSILSESVGIEKAMLSTVHSYTATQSIVDSPAKGDFRKGRAGAANIIPTSTGAAIATTQAITSLENKFDGVALRVPTIVGSIVDITFLASRETTKEEINEILSRASEEEKWQGIFSVTDEPIVSSDIMGNTHASIADLSMTRVVDGNLVKVMAWYDNEMGYTGALVKHVLEVGKNI